MSLASAPALVLPRGGGTEPSGLREELAAQGVTHALLPLIVLFDCLKNVAAMPLECSDRRG